jgi:Uncharacterized protein conserved in bacteria (DUF2188)
MTEHGSDLIVAPSDIDGWDVVREGEDVALTNHPTRDEAEAAARLRAEEEHTHVGHESHPLQEGAGGEDRGVKTYFFALVGLLLAITLLIVVISVVSSALSI